MASLSDDDLNLLWEKTFGQKGKFADDTFKLDLSKLSEDQLTTLGKVVAHYPNPTNDVYYFYASVLRVPNRIIMQTLLEG